MKSGKPPPFPPGGNEASEFQKKCSWQTHNHCDHICVFLFPETLISLYTLSSTVESTLSRVAGP